MLFPSLLRQIVCPQCRARLEQKDRILSCATCGRCYAVSHGIPILLPESAPPPPDVPEFRLSVLILAYNEAANLRRMLPVTRKVLDDLQCSYEVVVLDGNSKDDTVAAAESLGARVTAQRKPGYGNAFREGIAECRGEYVLTLDADMSHDPGFIRALWAAREQADLLVGSRYISGAEAEMTLFRRGLSLFMNGVFRRVLSIPLLDLSSGFRLYRREALADLELRGRDFDVLVEILVQMFSRGFTVREIPMYYKPRLEGQSNLRVARFGMSYARSLLGLWPMRNSLESADYDFRAYSSLIPLQCYWQRKRVATIRAMLDGQTESILDVGCGSSKLLQSLPSAVGLDLRLDKLRFMQRTNSLLVVGTIHRLPFPDASFETVICSQVIEHVPDTEGILQELRRVLTRGGRLILGTPDYDTWQWRFIEPIYDRVLPGGYAQEHVTHYTRSMLHGLLREAGFELLDEKYVCGAEWIGLARLV